MFCMTLMTVNSKHGVVKLRDWLLLCLCALQDAEGDKNAAMAMENPDNYVLKPQREGGGTLATVGEGGVRCVILQHKGNSTFCERLSTSCQFQHTIHIATMHDCTYCSCTGNNFFGDDVRTMLLKLGRSKERSAYVLMERVWPVEVENYPVR